MKPLLLAAACAAALSLACAGSVRFGWQYSAGSAGSASSALDTGNAQPSQTDASAAQARLIVNTNVALEVDDLRGAYTNAGNPARAAGGLSPSHALPMVRKHQMRSCASAYPASNTTAY